MIRDVEGRYGAQYADGRWMWQLGDTLLSGGYLKSPDEMNCPTLTRAAPYFEVGVYTIGTDKRTGMADPDDPLLAHLPGASVIPGGRKVWRSGSYAYMCMHHPYGTGVRASDYGEEIMWVWDVARLLGYAGTFGSLDGVNPREYFACGNAVTVFDNPVMKPLAMCRSFGVHEYYSRDYAWRHAMPRELAPAFGLTGRGILPTGSVATPMAYVDGHAKYFRGTFYDWMAMVVSPNVLLKHP